MIGNEGALEGAEVILREIDAAIVVTEPDGSAEVELIEFVEVEEYAKRGEKPPRAKSYRIKIDKEYFTVHVHSMTGRQLLELAQKLPPDKFKISEKLHGGEARRIGLDETVVFSEHCVERFMTLPLDATEG